MKKLNTEEIKQFADALLFTESEAKDITDLFYNLKKENPINHWRVLLPLNDVDEYIREWKIIGTEKTTLLNALSTKKKMNLMNMSTKLQSKFSQVKKHLESMQWKKKHSLFISCLITIWLWLFVSK